jgi:hypothetical protein
VQQWWAPSWVHLTYLHLNIDMDRATLQAVATHCPQLVYLECSTLAITQSHPQIQLLSLTTLKLTFKKTVSIWSQATVIVPVSACAALNAPLVKAITEGGTGTNLAPTVVGPPAQLVVGTAQQHPPALLLQ